jgi:hypothetical protein
VSSDWQDKGLVAYVNVDRDSASRLGISMADVDNALYNAFGQRLISTIYTQANQYRVVLEHDTSTTPGLEALDTIRLKSSDGGSVPLAMGAITPMVRMIIPIVSPCFSIHGKKTLSGVTRTMIKTRIEIATVVLWLIKPSAASPSRINRVVSNMTGDPCQNNKPVYSTRNSVNRQAFFDQ